MRASRLDLLSFVLRIKPNLEPDVIHVIDPRLPHTGFAIFITARRAEL